MNKGLLLVKKYKNRRLYNTESSEYITREELLGVIHEGRNVQVQDASSGENVTIETLLQILISESSETLPFIPPEFLHFLIRSKPERVNEFFVSFQPFLQTLLSPVANNQMSFPSFGSPFSSMFPGFPGMGASPWGQQSPNPPSDKQEIDDLKDRLQALEAELKRSANK
ncbi:hypothetical protein HOF92_03330 [bacterium]|jgi:polyhydroxyalkanoate synthesis repressor PhaR|nr:hypothetical protein [bacterium]